MEAILAYAGSHWLEWVCTVIAALAGIGYKNLSKKMEKEKEQNKAIAEGVQSLLRESIVANYNKYTAKGFCPIYAKESIKKVYAAYHGLGGNDVASSLYEKVLKMPEDPPADFMRKEAALDDDLK